MIGDEGAILVNANSQAAVAALEDRLRKRDPRFVSELLAESDSTVLAEVAGCWTAKESNQWTREEARRYLLLRKHQLGHEVIVRRLIDLACREGLPSVLAPAMVFIDESAIRGTKFRHVWTRSIHGRYSMETTSPPRLPDTRKISKRVKRAYSKSTNSWRLFSLPTRRFLQNKLWRAFREIAKNDLETNSTHYVKAASDAMRLYPDDLLRSNPKLLQCRGLLRLAFRHHPVLKWTSRRVQLREEKTLERLISDLAPTDVAYIDLWSSDAGKKELARIAQEARSNLMRAWADTMQNRI